ncbi:competence protein [Lactiplantibacillus garii]|uniref:Competence protein n=1 Tax=Lactiplantibacillus garii TaxID=2306423 RepID=A0A426DAK1_9LACO|nr:competence protein CoiA family protein [Lactiplantibacillus garii]RRK11546.1 competence protein [Lactiplantibacillus garii]
MLIAVDQHQTLVPAAQASRHGQYFCPGCTAPVILKRGAVMVPHFAHQPGSDCQAFSEGETSEHLRGKAQLAGWFERSGYQVRLEAPLPQLKQRPDVLVHRAGTAPLAIEFQCSPLSTQRLWERTVGYRQHGYRVLWLLGRPYSHGIRVHGKALKFLQNSPAWGYFVPLWDVQTASLTLHYQLLSLDCEPLIQQSVTFKASEMTVEQVLTTHPQLHAVPVVARHLCHYQQTVVLARLHQSGVWRDLQTFCYQHGGTLQQLPTWVVPLTAKPPLLTVPYLVWSVHLMVALRSQPAQLADQRLRQLCWQTLQPLLARNACVRHRGLIRTRLITQRVAELKCARVLDQGGAGWILNRTQLEWKKR